MLQLWKLNCLTEIAVSAGSKAESDPIIEIVSDRDRVSAGRTTMCDVESVNDCLPTVSDRFAVPPIDVESVKLTVSDRFAVPPVDVESVN